MCCFVALRHLVSKGMNVPKYFMQEIQKIILQNQIFHYFCNPFSDNGKHSSLIKATLAQMVEQLICNQ